MTYAWRNESLERRFWKHVPIGNPDDCWLWGGFLNIRGYGYVNKPKHLAGNPRPLAHRLSYGLVCGPIPDGLFICHHCDTPRCVNPRHLYAGTHDDNMRDKMERRRHHKHGVTHCVRGHEFTPENTYATRDGRRRCRRCQKARHAARRAKTHFVAELAQ